MHLNKALIYGNLTRDPELRALQSGTKVCTFSIATNRVYYDQDKNKKEEVQFHNVVVFGRQAENCGQYLRKGSSALVEGRIQTRNWEGEDKQKHYRTEIVAERVQFGPKAGGGQSVSAPKDQTPSSSVQSPTSGVQSEIDTIEYPEEDINPDDIPF